MYDTEDAESMHWVFHDICPLFIQFSEAAYAIGTSSANQRDETNARLTHAAGSCTTCYQKRKWSLESRAWGRVTGEYIVRVRHPQKESV
jgi:hypothetical protein